MALQEANQMAIHNCLLPAKDQIGLAISALSVGRRPEAAKNGPFFIRVRDGAGKYQVG